jgi:hypothetical protein
MVCKHCKMVKIQFNYSIVTKEENINEYNLTLFLESLLWKKKSIDQKTTEDCIKVGTVERSSRVGVSNFNKHGVPGT